MEGEDKVTTIVESERPEEVSIASSLIPYDRDDERAMYFGYRACGFSVREALVMIDRSKAWLSACRHEAKFVELEEKIPEFRRDLSKEYVEIETFRNFRLVLEKDYRILLRSLGLEKDSDGNTAQMNPADNSYLYKLRAHYTPQQLGILESLVKSGTDGFNFARWLSEHPDEVKFSRTDSVTMKRSVSG